LAESHSSLENTNQQPAIALESVSKLFSRFAALHDLTANFDSGKLYALLGENGAGKTTLLRIIAGLARPTQGTVRVFGSADLQSMRARIGYMAHSSLLYDELTGRENLAFYRGLYSDELSTNIEELLEAVGLANVDAKRRVNQYSQGMKQRLALARAMIHSPRLLLLDEPFSNVDGNSIAMMTQLLGNLRDSGATLIVITHQPEALAGVADEWITLQAGAIVRRESARAFTTTPVARGIQR
jgi:heme ABC exporter ATP-binding subunit CcmA